MIRRNTLLGVAPPAQLNIHHSGRYSVVAPEAPVGSVLKVTMRNGSTRLVLVAMPHEKRVFVDVDCQPVDFVKWEFASRSEEEAFHLEWEIGLAADVVEICGAMRFFQDTLSEMPAEEQETWIQLVSDELRRRGYLGRAQSLRAYATATREAAS